MGGARRGIAWTKRSGRSGFSAPAFGQDKILITVHLARINFDGTRSRDTDGRRRRPCYSARRWRRSQLALLARWPMVSRHLLARGSSSRDRAAARRGREVSLRPGRSGREPAFGHGLAAARAIRGEGARREHRHLWHHHPADEFRSEEEVSRDRRYLPRVLTDTLCRRSGAAASVSARSPNWASSSVQIDGMGTNWRARAFHDVAWKNLKDSGFPDRIAWMRAAAAQHPEMDVTRVGSFRRQRGRPERAGGAPAPWRFLQGGRRRLRMP